MSTLITPFYANNDTHGVKMVQMRHNEEITRDNGVLRGDYGRRLTGVCRGWIRIHYVLLVLTNDGCVFFSACVYIIDCN